MAPTTDEVYTFVSEHTAQYPGELWEWNALVAATRRHFRSTTPAIATRMRELYDNGRIKAIRIGHSGLIFWNRDNLPDCYLDFVPRYSYDRLEHAPVALWENRRNKDNLWANNVRNFFIVDTAYDTLIATFQEIADQKKAASRDRRRQERAMVREGLTKAAEDGPKLLKALSDALVEQTSRVYPWVYSGIRDDEVGTVHLNIDLSGQDLKTFLDIIRPGLVMREVYAEKAE